MKNIAIIPARSGSKGLKDKNIKELKGVPLLAYSIKAAKESGIFEEIMVSTDSQTYADIAIEFGATVPFLRSSEQSGDNAGSWGVVKEVLNKYVEKGQKFDTVCLLQPTSPLRTAENIVDGYGLLEEKEADAITAVCEMDHSPLWAMTLPDDGSLSEFRKKFQYMPRQKLNQYYRINGALYIRRISYLNGRILLQESNEYAYIMDRRRSIDIDTAEDFELAEWYLHKILKLD